jgi:hypothetical protein
MAYLQTPGVLWSFYVNAFGQSSLFQEAVPERICARAAAVGGVPDLSC